jgi:hypothetical protein
LMGRSLQEEGDHSPWVTLLVPFILSFCVLLCRKAQWLDGMGSVF